MKINTAKILNQTKALIIVGMMILIGQRIGFGQNILEALPFVLIVLALSLFALIMKDLFPNLKFPAFAWASLSALILSMPFMPTHDFFMKLNEHVEFLGTTTPILAFAGISVGNKIEKLKKLSWKVVLVAIFVFMGTFFGSAIVAQIVLKLQGII